MKTINVKHIQKPINKTLHFERKGDARMGVKIRFDGERLSIQGTLFNWSDNMSRWEMVSSGQNLDDLIQYFVDMPNAKRLYEIWNKYHLNDLTAGDAAQEAHLEWLESQGLRPKGYRATLEALRKVGLETHNGYRYGSAWQFTEIPAKIIEELRAM